MTPDLIYESPDNGETVFARMIGTLERTKISETPKAHYLARWHVWKDILRVAEDNVTLNDLINRVEEVYALVKDPA